METIKELRERIDGLVTSIKDEDVGEKRFIEHKYILISLHAHTERCKLETGMRNSQQKLLLNKQYKLYMSIEELLSKKAYESTAVEMYHKIIECQQLVTKSVPEYGQVQ